MANIKESLEAINFCREAALAVGEVLEDGKISLLDLPTIIPLFSKVQVALEGSQLIPGELMDLEKVEVAQIATGLYEVVAAVWDVISQRHA